MQKTENTKTGEKIKACCQRTLQSIEMDIHSRIESMQKSTSALNYIEFLQLFNVESDIYDKHAADTGFFQLLDICGKELFCLDAESVEAIFQVLVSDSNIYFPVPLSGVTQPELKGAIVKVLQQYIEEKKESVDYSLNAKNIIGQAVVAGWLTKDILPETIVSDDEFQEAIMDACYRTEKDPFAFLTEKDVSVFLEKEDYLNFVLDNFFEKTISLLKGFRKNNQLFSAFKHLMLDGNRDKIIKCIDLVKQFPSKFLFKRIFVEFSRSSEISKDDIIFFTNQLLQKSSDFRTFLCDTLKYENSELYDGECENSELYDGECENSKLYKGVCSIIENIDIFDVELRSFLNGLLKINGNLIIEQLSHQLEKIESEHEKDLFLHSFINIILETEGFYSINENLFYFEPLAKCLAELATRSGPSAIRNLWFCAAPRALDILGLNKSLISFVENITKISLSWINESINDPNYQNFLEDCAISKRLPLLKAIATMDHAKAIDAYTFSRITYNYCLALPFDSLSDDSVKDLVDWSKGLPDWEKLHPQCQKLLTDSGIKAVLSDAMKASA